MEQAQIARIAVASATYSIDKPYDYLIPEQLADGIRPGVRVIVPFGRGNRSSEGIVLACGSGEKRPDLKAIAEILDTEPVLDADGIALASFLRQRTFCTMYEAVKAILPAGLWFQRKELCRLRKDLTPEEALALAEKTEGAGELLEFLFASGGTAELSQLRAVLGPKAEPTVRSLARKGILCIETESLRRTGDKMRRMAELAVDSETALEEAERKRSRAPIRSEALRFLATSGKTSAAELSYYTGASSQTLRALEKAGLIRLTEEEVFRVPDAAEVPPGAPIVLNEEQSAVFDDLLLPLSGGKAAAALIEGVTGSGKTEVYIRLVQETLRQGRNAMVLVPEIILTPQMMRKFSSYFGAQVVMLHSGLRLTERYDQWKRIRNGEVRVVLGTRSAVFSPLKELGLLILDEEQDGSYQSENAPRYHTRDIAKFLCSRSGALLVLGSATPSVESAWYARQGIYRHELLRRRYNEKSLPRVEIADLRQEIRRGNAGSVSEPLRRELQRNLEAGEQSILFLNRRGNSRMLVCGECGRVTECPRCSVPLTYHSANGRLMCHYCGHSEKVPAVCPDCGGIVKYVGTGTQKVEEELRELFPGVDILRMDADTADGNHEALLKRFETEKIPILLGTQMVTKGLDFENVTLVGVLSADLSLYVDHYRAAERTFSLLTQVVGRAGRGEKQGRAVIQTYTPENEVIRSAAQQDYEHFYESEIRLRRLRRCPPFADLFTFTVSGVDEGSVLRAAAWLRGDLRARLSALLPGEEAEVLGPAPAPVVRVNNRYRYRCVLVGRNTREMRELVSGALKEFTQKKEHRGLAVFADCNSME